MSDLTSSRALRELITSPTVLSGCTEAKWRDPEGKVVGTMRVSSGIGRKDRRNQERRHERYRRIYRKPYMTKQKTKTTPYAYTCDESVSTDG